MVSLKEIRESNAHVNELQLSPDASNVAVFVGATSGIGASTVKQFASKVKKPLIYIIGRSEKKAIPQLDELKNLNPQGVYKFIEAEVSLIREIDRVCNIIKRSENHIDLLFMTVGALSLNGRQDTSEGLALNLALTYYGRLRFAYNLLPLLSNGRIVSVLGGGQEGEINLKDLDLKTTYSFLSSPLHGATMTSLAFEHLSKENPTVSFIHAFPGLVQTDLIKNLLGDASGWTWFLTTIAKWTVYPIARLFWASLDEAGERGLYEATSERFKAAATGPEEVGKSFFRVDEKQDLAKEVPILEKYKAEGVPKKVWEHTLAMWDAVLA